MGSHPPLTAGELQAAVGPRYIVGPPLAPGGQASVFRATRVIGPAGEPTNDDIALKVYGTHVEQERVDREVILMSGVRHRCLPTLLEHGRVLLNGTDHRFVAWEFVDGSALNDQLLAGPPPLKEIAMIGRDVSGAIGALWQKRVVHRDVKPQNIMMRRAPNEAVLVDLGAARHLNSHSITLAGYTLGTMGYLSPEQTRAERNLSCKSDIYSLGVVLLECLSGAHPTGRNQTTLTATRLSTSAIAPLAPARLAALVDAMVVERAAHRPAPESAELEFDHIYQLL